MQRTLRVSEGCCLLLSGYEAVSQSSYSFWQIIGSPVLVVWVAKIQEVNRPAVGAGAIRKHSEA